MLMFNSRFLLVLLSLGDLEANAQTLYRLKSYRPYFTTSTNQNMRTRIVCALKCFSLRCPYFTFQDSSCQIHDPGFVATNDSSEMYEPFDPAAPLSPETLIDVAFQKTCYRSSHYAHNVADRAVDGNMRTQFYANDLSGNWWGVDLGNSYIIRVIDVLPHMGVANWFRNVKMYVGATLVQNGDFSSYTEVAYYPGPWNGVGRLQFTPTTVAIGRFLFLQGISGTKRLNLLDVKVMV